mgnify:CR=1 FL=1
MVSEVFLKIYGEVHGVGFRYETRQSAERLDLTGWVRNAPDSTVEIRAQGEKELLEKLIAWVRQSSPGTVEKIEIEWREPQNLCQSFEIQN